MPGAGPTYDPRPFEGAVVRVEVDGSWRFYRCSWCRRPLTDPESVAVGYGPECRRKYGDAALVERRERLRVEDRRAYRRFLEVEAIRKRTVELGRFPDDGTGIDPRGRVTRGWR